MTKMKQINREHKATLFALIFSEAEDALSLYNAMNGTDYDDPDLLEFNTIKNVIYIGMKNDVSFLIGTDMNLYEAQSTWNPNMPLRGLFYLAELYKGYVNTNNLDIYSSVQLRLPQPRYVVFYNGPSGQPDVQDLRLSASFVGGEGRAAGLSGRTAAISDPVEEISGHAAGTSAPVAGLSEHAAGLTGREPALECIAHVVNINYGHNQELMGKCRKLWEYAYLIGAIRRNIAKGMTVEEAVDLAVQECIAKGILAEMLAKNRAEVTNMILEEYDEEFHIRCEKQLSREEGRKEGRAEGREEGRLETLIMLTVRKLARGKSSLAIAEELEADLPVIQMICEAASSCAPEYDCNQIYQKMLKLRADSESAQRTRKDENN